MNKKLLLLLNFYCFCNISVRAQNLQWAKTAGASAADIGSSIAVDLSGNVYSTGNFEGTVDFDYSAAVNNLTSAGGTDVFITKMDASGNLLWAKNVGGLNDEQGLGIAVDNNGSVYLTGMFNGTADFDPNVGIANLSVIGPTNDIFVLKLDQIGNYVWAKNFGNYGSDVGRSIALDANNNVYFTGYYNGIVDFDPGNGIQNLSSINGRDIFICKLDQNANYIWAKSMGSTQGEEGLSIALDSAGSVYTTGFFSDTTDFDPGANIFNLNASGMDNIYISKLDVDGNFVWAKSIGNTEPCHGTAIAVNNIGATYVTGYFQGTIDFDPGAGVLNLNASGKDIFIVKLDSIGDFIWAKNLGGTNTDYGYSIAIDGQDNVYTTGTYEGTADFDPNAGTFNLTAQFIRDMFICKLDGAGNLVWAKNITGSAGLSEGNDIAVDAFENIYTTGFYYGTVDFDFNTGLDNHVTTGVQDFFVMKVDQLPTHLKVIEAKPTFSVYPNPSNGTFFIQNSIPFQDQNMAITVTDINGHQILNSTQVITENSSIQITLNQAAKGIYFLKIQSHQTIYNVKIIVL